MDNVQARFISRKLQEDEDPACYVLITREPGSSKIKVEGNATPTFMAGAIIALMDTFNKMVDAQEEARKNAGL